MQLGKHKVTYDFILNTAVLLAPLKRILCFLVIFLANNSYGSSAGDSQAIERPSSEASQPPASVDNPLSPPKDKAGHQQRTQVEYYQRARENLTMQTLILSDEAGLVKGPNGKYQVKTSPLLGSKGFGGAAAKTGQSRFNVVCQMATGQTGGSRDCEKAYYAITAAQMREIQVADGKLAHAIAELRSDSETGIYVLDPNEVIITPDGEMKSVVAQPNVTRVPTWSDFEKVIAQKKLDYLTRPGFDSELETWTKAIGQLKGNPVCKYSFLINEEISIGGVGAGSSQIQVPFTDQSKCRESNPDCVCEFALPCNEQNLANKEKIAERKEILKRTVCYDRKAFSAAQSARAGNQDEMQRVASGIESSLRGVLSNIDPRPKEQVIDYRSQEGNVKYSRNLVAGEVNKQTDLAYLRQQARIEEKERREKVANEAINRGVATNKTSHVRDPEAAEASESATPPVIATQKFAQSNQINFGSLPARGATLPESALPVNRTEEIEVKTVKSDGSQGSRSLYYDSKALQGMVDGLESEASK